MDKYYYELIITIDDKYIDIFLDLVNSLSDEAIEQDKNRLILRSANNLEYIAYGIYDFSKKLNISCDVKNIKKENQDWIKQYQQAIKPITINDFYIHPPWQKEKKDLINLQIQPTLSFGSGHHQSTKNCIKFISQFTKKGDIGIDVGCGSGILGIAMAKKGASVDICDTDKKSLVDSIKAFKVNKVQISHHWVGSINKSNKKYDIIVANIVADILMILSKDLQERLKNNGILIISGILDKFKNKVMAKFNNLELIDMIQENEWITIAFRNINGK